MSTSTFQILSVIEIIIVNLMLFHANVKPRYSTRFIFLILAIYTALIIPLGILLTNLIGLTSYGNALYTMYGFLYLLPFHYLYKEGFTKHFFIICFCWVYTLLVSLLAVQIGYIVGKSSRFIIIFIVETTVFLASIYYAIHFMKKIYLPLMKGKGKRLQHNLNRASIAWFLTILSLAFHFIYEDSHYLKIIVVITICMNIVFNIELIRELLKREKTIGTLETQVTQDFLTKIGNRMAFKNLFDKKMARNTPFALIYLDLDNFKGINDTYGHSVGDLYLQEFAVRLSDIGGRKNVFRISGDEFALFTSLDRAEIIVRRIRDISFVTGIEHVPFKGASCGIVKCPEEGHDFRLLLDIADKKMYDMKSMKEKLNENKPLN